MKTAPESPLAILVVEDEFLIRLAAVAILEQAGFEVLPAGSAEEALPLVPARADIAVLFTDINMPGRMSGLDLAFDMRRRWPTIGLLLTSSSRPSDLKMLGGARFLAKPYLAEELVAGPRQAKGELVKHLEAHDPAWRQKIVGTETVDHPSDNQLVAHARKYFRIADRMRPQRG